MKKIASLIVVATALCGFGCTGSMNTEAKTAADADVSAELEAERKARMEAEMKLRDDRALVEEGIREADAQFAPQSAPEAPAHMMSARVAEQYVAGMAVQDVPQTPEAPSVFPQPAPQSIAGLPGTPFTGPTYDPYYGSLGPTVGYVGAPENFPLEDQCGGMCVAMFNRSHLPFSVQVGSEVMTHMFGGPVSLSAAAVVIGPDGSRSVQNVPLVPGTRAGVPMRASPGRLYFLYNCDEENPRCMMGGRMTVTVKARFYRMTPGERFAKPVGCWSQTIRLPHRDPWGQKLYPEYRPGEDC